MLENNVHYPFDDGYMQKIQPIVLITIIIMMKDVIRKTITLFHIFLLLQVVCFYRIELSNN